MCQPEAVLSRDEFAKAAMQTMLAHYLCSPINQSTHNSMFDMDDIAGRIARDAWTMADHMLYHGTITTNPTPQ